MAIVCFIPTYLDDNGVPGYLQSTGDIHRVTHQLQSASLLVGGGGSERGKEEGRRGMGERGRRGVGERGEAGDGGEEERRGKERKGGDGKEEDSGRGRRREIGEEGERIFGKRGEGK